MFNWRAPSLRFKPKRHSFGGPGPWSGHLAFAYDLIAEERPELLVELGAFYGESYFGFCQAVQENAVNCTCYAVDTWHGDSHGGFYEEEIYSNVEAYNRAHYLSYSHLLRMTFDEALSSFSEDSVDILHIDGHHSYESARKDFESWLPKVRPGGVILLHDIGIRTTGFGVWRLWQELSTHYPHYAFSHSAGLGVLLKPGPEAPGEFLADLIGADPEHQAFVAAFYAALAERHQFAFDGSQLRKKAARRTCCSVQVFYSLGEGYNEENSTVRLVEVGTECRVTFELPRGIPCAPLRLDPVDRACVVEISAITILCADRSDVLFHWDAAGTLPEFEVRGNARVLGGREGIALACDGIDPQLFLSGIGGEEYDRPLEMDLTLRIIAGVDLDGLIIPLSDFDGLNASLELDRALPPDEARPGLSQLLQLFREQHELAQQLNRMLAELGRKGEDLASVIGQQSSRLSVELASVRAALDAKSVRDRSDEADASQFLGELGKLRDALAETTETVSFLTNEAWRLSNESTLSRASANASQTELTELRTRLESATLRCEDLEQSWSWRITAPARSFLNLFRRRTGS